MKSRNKIAVLAFLLASLHLAANAAGKSSVTEVRTSNSYHHLHIEGTFDVIIEESDLPGVTVEGSKFQIHNTITMLRNDTLFVYQTNLIKSGSRTRVHIKVDNLALLEVKGDATVDCTSLINSDMLTVKASEGARIRLDVRAIKVESKATGCSHIQISGISSSSVEDIDECGTIDSHLLDVIDHKKPYDLICIEC